MALKTARRIMKIDKADGTTSGTKASKLKMPRVIASLYRLAITLGIFSLLAFVPEVVPSALSIFIILLAVFNATNGLVKNLYFSTITA